MVQLTFTEMKTEMNRRKSKRDDLLTAFKMKKTLYTGDIINIAGSGVSSRIKELKRQGNIIVSQYIRPGVWSYTYKGHEDNFKEYADVD